VLATSLFLAGCTGGDIEPEIPETEESGAELVMTDEQYEQELAQWEADFRRQRLIGDLLYDALNALNEDRLLTPVDNNAHGRYQRVLAYDPDNALALEGLQNIVNRYVELATDASRQGRFAAAQSLLERARFVDPKSQNIVDAQAALEVDMDSDDLVFELDLESVRTQSEKISNELSDIAIQAREHGAFLWITAPTDEQARWMYGVMREAVTGYRLRGNIESGSLAIIRLRMPTDNPIKPDEEIPQNETIIINPDGAISSDDLN
jgi:hypothetical protein